MAKRPPMSKTQFREALDTLGLTKDDAADMLGISRRAAFGYARGEKPISKPVAKLLRLVLRYKVPPEEVV